MGSHFHDKENQWRKTVFRQQRIATEKSDILVLIGSSQSNLEILQHCEINPVESLVSADLQRFRSRL